MARLFSASGTTKLANTAGAPATAMPITFSCWVYPTAFDDPIGAGSLISLLDTDGSLDAFNMRIENNGSLRALTTSSGTDGQFAESGAGTVVLNSWQHCACTFVSTTSRAVFLNGAKFTNAVSATAPSGVNDVALGAMYNISPDKLFFTGRMAEAAIWNVALSDDEIISLSRKFSPALVRPTALAAYWPLMGAVSPEPDLKGGYPLTITGSVPKADHVPIIARRRPSYPMELY